MYRVKEYNSAYSIGWIYITNIVNWDEAVKVATKHELRSGLKTKIVQQ